MQIGLLSLALGAVLLLSGCVMTDTAYTLNPDGSGKVDHRLVLMKMSGNWTDAEPDKELAQALIRSARGIEAWDEVHYRIVANGNAVEFRGTGYFQDLNKVSLTFLNSKDGNNFKTPIPCWKLEKLPDGRNQLVAREDSYQPPAAPSKPAGGLNLDQLGDAMQMSIFLSADIRTRFLNAGKIESETFQSKPDGSAELKYDGSTVAENMKSPDPGNTGKGEVSAKFKNGIWDSAEIRKLAFEKEGPVTLTLTLPAQPVFDYAAEVTAADIKVEPSEQEGWKKLKTLE